ncbi:N-acetylneuraminate lyase [Alkalihalophilus marmarensis]|jgi:N-acetylneuraminate lyase|uniref:N-acetylneuraminate lyase n=1 Tax=Alkalihalophilus marmarensis TaxID=521377 RepID=UPI00204211E0|nr:N-acetylneuraminate lyase [Alkalihalophilus marmarensis]MCM3491732.1 N-acetylneuraminate lyase [Alkalihalophilus marmarensis]
MKGVITALMVSYDREGNLNEKGLREIIRYNLDVCKVDGLYVNGSTGENFMISTEEKKDIFRITKDEVKDQVPLIAQVGSVNLKEAIDLAKYATNLGYDALSAVTPFYYKFNFNEIKHYYNSIINAVENKMIIYSIPFLTGVDMSLDQFTELFENEKIIGVKFTAGDFYLLERMRKTFPEKLIYAGFDEMLLPATVLGIDGAIGSTFNVNGHRARKILELGKQGKIEEAREIQHVTNDLITEILNNGLYQTIKEMLKEKGVDAGYCRAPMEKLSEDKVATARELTKTYL